MSAQTQALVGDFGKYYDAYPSHDKIDLLTFMPKFRNWHPGMSDEQFMQYIAILRNIQPDPDEDQERNLVGDIAQIEMMTAAANLASQFDDGDLHLDPYEAMGNILDQYRKRRGLKAVTWCDTPIEDLLDRAFDDKGILWRLGCLNQSMRGLRPGDFGIIAGRPDSGKTSFIASEVTYMAPQLPPDRNVVWLTNEGLAENIRVRAWQAALGATMDEMRAFRQAGTLTSKYRDLVQRLDRIRIFEVHNFTTGQVDNLLEENNPGIIVYDMIDKIRGFGEAARTDLQLERMYDWAREGQVKYGSIGLATSQISNEGEGLMFPSLGMLKDSKTGKQGACDFQLMIGRSNDDAFINSRFIGLPKNKLRRTTGPADPKAEVIFDQLRARYTDVPIGA